MAHPILQFATNLGTAFQKTTIANSGSGYTAGISIEPHMVVVFHDAEPKNANEDTLRKNFVEYGKRLETLVAGARGAAKTPA